MAESAEPLHGVAVESSIAGGAVPLASILLTEELDRRPSRPPEFEKKNSALAALVSVGEAIRWHGTNLVKTRPTELKETTLAGRNLHVQKSG